MQARTKYMEIVTALDPAYGQEVDKPRAPAVGGPGGPM
jgi:hypothetical protein